MTPDLLREHIRRCREATRKPFGVNVPLMYRYADQIIETVIEERVPVVFTSAGDPKSRTAQLHEAGCKVAHVVSSSKFARKSEEAGVDAVVAEGFEAGGHNGRWFSRPTCAGRCGFRCWRREASPRDGECWRLSPSGPKACSWARGSR